MSDPSASGPAAAAGTTTPGSETLLDGVRIVDLAGEPATMTGRILSDLGAHVVRLVPPGGDPLASVAPFDSEGVGLRHIAFTSGKRLYEVGSADDPLFAEFLADADIVLTTPGWPGVLEAAPSLAPQAVWVQVTPFGTTGPRASWKATDLGIMASTGNMYCTGDPDRAPVRCTEPTAWAHVGPEAAVAALTALATGRPQIVDVSVQEAVMIASMGHPSRFPRTGNRGKRSGANIGVTREIWPCADGFVSFGLRGGKARIPNLQTITRLVDEDGLATAALTERDWTTYDHNKATSRELAAISEPIAAYFLRHTMAELYEVAVETNLMLAPANSPKELLASAQLAARDFFIPRDPFEHFPRSFATLRSPGDVVRRPGPPRRAADISGASVLPTSPTPWRRPAANGSRATGAWEDTRIIEFGTGAAGPIAVRYFAEHGATVIRVESSSRPDFLRTYSTPGDPCGLNGSNMFDSVNVGKLGVSLNLKHPDAVALANRLIAWAGTIAENYAPRAMRGFGLDYDTLVGELPDLVMVSSCLQGQTGPHRDYPGFGGQGSALAGYNLLTGWPDREPVGPFGTITDSLAPRFTAAALAAGLLYRRRTGRGVHLDVSQVEAAAFTLSPWILDYVANGHVGERDGNRSRRFVPHGAFPCAGEDRWVAISCADDAEWARLADQIGVAADTRDALAAFRQRVRRVDEVETLVADWTVQQKADDIADRLQALGIEAVPIADLADAFADPQLAHRGHFVPLTHPCMGECDYERNGFRLSDESAGYPRTSPLLGEHTEYVFGELLGIASSELDGLRADGAFD